MRTSVHETDTPAAARPGTPTAPSGATPATAFLVQRSRRGSLISCEVLPPRPARAAAKAWSRIENIPQAQPARTVDRSDAKQLWHGEQHLPPVVPRYSPALTLDLTTMVATKASSGEQGPQGPVDPWWSSINPMLTAGFGLGSACSPARGPPPRGRRGPSRNNADVCMK